MMRYLYAVELNGIGIRIGVTSRAGSRVKQHKSTLRSYGLIGIVGRYHETREIRFAELAEKEVHKRFDDLQVNRSREVFNVSFEEAVEAIESMHGWEPKPREYSNAWESDPKYYWPEGYITVGEYCKLYGSTPSRVRYFIKRHKIETHQHYMSLLISPLGVAALRVKLKHPPRPRTKRGLGVDVIRGALPA